MDRTCGKDLVDSMCRKDLVDSRCRKDLVDSRCETDQLGNNFVQTISKESAALQKPRAQSSCTSASAPCRNQ